MRPTLTSTSRLGSGRDSHPVRRPDDMTERARELTLERGDLNVYRVLANAENVFPGWMAAGRAALSSPVLSRRLRELVTLRTAAVMDCPYELGQHNDIATHGGLTESEIKATVSDSDWRTAGFSSGELAVLQLTTRASDHPRRRGCTR